MAPRPIATGVPNGRGDRICPGRPRRSTYCFVLTEGCITAQGPPTSGPSDILFNCAGIVHAGTVLECSDADWDRAFAINVTAMFHTIRAVLPGMLARGGGSIINMSSVASSVTGVPNRFAYGASKAAVVGITKSVAADFVARGIRCNAICPGTVESPSLRDRVRAQADSSGRAEADVLAEFEQRQPMGRLGRPAEIAALAVYLASDESALHDRDSARLSTAAGRTDVARHRHRLRPGLRGRCAAAPT